MADELQPKVTESNDFNFSLPKGVELARAIVDPSEVEKFDVAARILTVLSDPSSSFRSHGPKLTVADANNLRNCLYLAEFPITITLRFSKTRATFESINHLIAFVIQIYREGVLNFFTQNQRLSMSLRKFSDDLDKDLLNPKQIIFICQLAELMKQDEGSFPRSIKFNGSTKLYASKSDVAESLIRIHYRLAISTVEI